MKTIIFVVGIMLIAVMPGHVKAAYTLHRSLFVKPANEDVQTVKQQRGVHQSIKTFIAKNYPAAKVRLFLPEETDYRIRFKMDEHHYTSLFSINGKWMETSVKVRFSEIPERVKHAVETGKYSNGKTYGVEEVTLSAKPGKLFVLEVGWAKHNTPRSHVNMAKEFHKLYYSSSGRLVKDELEKDESLPYVAWGDD